MKHQSVFRTITTWTMVAVMLPWSSFVYGGLTVNQKYGIACSTMSSGVNTALGDVQNNVEYDDLMISSDTVLKKDMEVGNLVVTGALDLGGHTIKVHGDAKVHGSGAVYFHNGEILCDGGFYIYDATSLRMESEDDYLLVGGTATFTSNTSGTVTSEAYVLKAGTIELKGDVTFGEVFKAEKDHQVVFSGEAKQSVSQNDKSMLGTVILQNQSDEGIELNSGFSYQTIQKNGCNISTYSGSGIVGETLEQDEEYDGTLILDTGTMDLAGHVMTVHGDFVLNGGTLRFSGGTLVVEGDFRHQKRTVNSNREVVYGTNAAALSMNTESSFDVKGDYYINSSSISDLAGTVQVDGSVILGSDTKASSLTVSGETHILRDVLLNSKKNSSTITCTGKLDVDGNVTGTNGVGSVSFSQKKGTVSVLGNSDEVQMLCSVSGASYIVNGDYSLSKGTADKLTDGTLEVKGDVNAPGLLASGSHRLLLSGDKLQTVTGAASMTLGTLSLANTSSEGVYFDTVVRKEDLVSNGCKLRYGDLTGETGWKLEQDTELDSLTMLDGNLDLNGHKLTVHGDFIQMSGNVLIDGGKLTVGGDYRLQTAGRSGGEMVYGTSASSLTMQEEDAEITVGGDFIIDTNANLKGTISKGSISVGGDFTVSTSDFFFGDAVTLNLSGNKKQTLLLPEGASVPYLDMSGASEIVLVTPVTVTKQLASDADVPCNGTVILSDEAAHKGSGFGGTLKLTGGYNNAHKFGGTYTIGGDLLLEGYADVYGTLVVKGNLTGRNGGYIETKYTTTRLEVGGDLTLVGGYYRSKGTVTVGGDCTIQYGHFTDSHKLVLNGTGKQVLDIDDTSELDTLELQNHSADGVVATRLFTVKTFEKSGCNFRYEGIEGEIGEILTADRRISGDYTLLDGTLDLAGHTLEVTRDLIQAGGTILLNGGTLIIGGDLRQQTRKDSGEKDASGKPVYSYEKSQGTIRMDAAEDCISIGGSLVIDTKKPAENVFNSGILEIGQDMQCAKNTGIVFGDGIKLVLTPGITHSLENKLGTEAGRIVLDSLVVGSVDRRTGEILPADETESTVITGNALYVNGVMDVGKTVIYPTVYVNETTAVRGDQLNASLNGSFAAPSPLVVRGDFTGDLMADVSVEIKKNADFRNLVVKKGTVTVGGNCTVEDSVQLLSDSSKVMAEHNFYRWNHTNEKDSLDKGYIEVKGDVTGVITASGNHRFILSGEEEQHVGVYNSHFATLEINNHSEEGIVVDNELVYDRLIDNSCVIHFALGETLKAGTLKADTVLSDDFIFSGGVLDLAGHTLTIDGSLLHTAGTIRFNGGTLIIKGELREEAVESIYGSGNDSTIYYGEGKGILEMNDENDRIIVEDTIVWQVSSQSDCFKSMRKGEIHAWGGLYYSLFTYTGMGDMSTGTEWIFEGDREQSIRTSTNSGKLTFASLGLTGKGRKDIPGIIEITKKLSSTGSAVGGKLWVYDPNVIESGFIGTVSLMEGGSLNKDLSISGTLVLNAGLNLNGHTLSCGNLVLENGGTLTMTRDEDTVLVDEDLSVNARYGLSRMTAGTISVHGDLTNKNPNGFYATGSHELILDPKQSNAGYTIQHISLAQGEKTAGADPVSMMNRLVLTGPRSAYSFTPDAEKIAAEVIDLYDGEDIIPVTNLACGSVTANTVVLTFDDPNEGVSVSGYRILRDGEAIAVTGRHTFTDRGLVPGTTYQYAVAPLDKSGHMCAVSEEISVVTLQDTEGPSVPRNLSVKAQTGKSITLSWDASTDDTGVKGYRLYRDGALVFHDTAQKRSYRDTDVEPNRIYRYQVEAYDTFDQVSERSDILSATVGMPEIIGYYPQEYSRLGKKSARLDFTYRTYGKDSIYVPRIEIEQDGTWKNVTSYNLSRDFGDGWATASCDWNYERLEQEEVHIRYSVTDEDGLVATETVIYEVDHSAPEEPQNVSVEDDQGVAVLLWDAPKDADLDRYVLWRAVKDAEDTTPDGELIYEQICQLGKTRTRYEDNTVAEGKVAYYILSSVDDLGNASLLLHPVSVQIGKDGKAPEVTGLTPESGAVGNSVSLSATAKDNKKVQKFRFSYKAEDADAWTDISTVNAYEYSDEEGAVNTAAAAYGTVTYFWSLPSLTTGNYMVRVIAVDSSGNESEGYTRRYTVDQNKPKAPKITKTNAGATYAQLMWDEPEDAEIRQYIVWMKGGSSAFYQSVGVSEDVLGFTKDGLVPNTEYSFYVCALSGTDVLGEQSEVVSITTTADTTPPVIRSVGPASGYISDTLELTATVEDNHRVGKLVWSYSSDGKVYKELAAPSVSSVGPLSIGRFGTSGQKAEYHYAMDLSDREVFPEGSLFIKTEAWDTAGNKAVGSNGDVVVEYRIDHTPPAKPENFVAEPGDGYIALSWAQGQEEDLAKYRIWRRTGTAGRPSLLAELTTLNHYDTSVKPGQFYQYYIEAVDQVGNVSAATDYVSATALEDETAPVIHGVSPVDGNTVGTNPELTFAITDNAELGKAFLEYQDKYSGFWNPVSEWKLSGNSVLLKETVDLTSFEETDYLFRVFVEDTAGNQSTPFYVNYNVDKTAPTGSLTATGGHFVVDLSLKHNTKRSETNDVLNRLPGSSYDGSQGANLNGAQLEELLSGAEESTGGDDFAYYEIYRVKLSDARTDLAFYRNARAVTKTINDSYQDKSVEANVAYRYAAKVYDAYGNWSWTGISDAISDSIDVEAPVISVTKRITVVAGMNVPLDAGNSKDNVKIRSFRWEMGNGDTVTGVRPKYAYQKAGTYRIKLTVTDTAGNKAEETIEARILEPSRSGIVYLHVVDEQSRPIPYATYYVKNGSEQTTPCMADETGVITLVYPAGTYTVAVFRDGYMPAEHDVEIETLLEKDDYIPLFKGDVVIGEFHVERLSLQEMIDQGVDLSDPANVNTFTFKTTLTFQQEPIPISWDTREGDIILDMNQDNVKPGGIGTSMHGGGGGGGGGPEDPKPDSNRKEKVVVSVIGPPEAPVIAVLTTTQSVSWMKSMYQATLTVANTADSKYVLEDSTAEIHLPEGVSLAALTRTGERTEEKMLIHSDNSVSKTLHISGDTALLHLGDIPGQEQRSASWILKGDKSGTYQLEAEFNGLLTPFNVPIKKVFRTEETMQVPQANVRITVMPEEKAFCDDTYFIQYAITNEGSEPLYNFKTSIGDYKMPGQRYAVAEIDEKTGIVTPVSDTGNSIVYELPVSEQIYHMPVLSHGDRISIPTLLPGQTIYGTWHSGIPDAAGNTGTEFSGDPYTQYYELISSVVDVIEGENLGVHVEIDPIPSHTTKVLLAHCTESDVYLKLGDPVDLASGSFTETSEGLSITGHDTLSFGLSYDSVLAGMTPDQSTASRRTGAGWTGNYQSYIREENGMIFYQMNPYISASFISEEAYGGKGKGSVSVTGDTSTVDLQEEPDVEKEELRFVSVTRGMDGFVLIRHTDGTYTLEMPSGESQDFNAEGRLSRLTTAEGRAVSVRQSRNQTILTEDLTGTRLILTYDDEERLISVSDDTGRKTQYLYTGDDLTKVINPLGESTTYVYDEKHRIIEEKDDEGYVVLTNTYDEDGRVVSQKDMTGIETTFAYVPDGKGGSTNTATRKQPGYDPVSTSVTVNAGEQIISATTAAGLTETYTYDSAGNMISSTDGYGNVRTYAYDEAGRLLSSTDPEGQTMTVRYENGNPVEISDGKTTTRYSYDSRGLLLHADQNGAVTDYTYDDSGILKTINRKGLGTTTYEITNGRITGETNPLGGTVQYAYDAVGNLTGFTDARGGKLQYTYDLLGRKTAETDALGNTTRYTFDSYGRCDSKTDPSGVVTKYRYDMAGHLICIVQPDGAEQKYSYDAAGHITAWTRPDGSKLTYETDCFGQITKVTYPDGTTEQRFYDTVGNLTRSIDAAGQETTYSYDNRQRLTGRKDANGRTTKLTYNTDGSVQTASVDEQMESYTYDATGHMTSVTDPIGNTETYTYDVWGRCLTETDVRGNVTKYTYDAVGNCTKAELPTGVVVESTYDAGCYLTEQSAYIPSRKETLREKYTYDAAGNVTMFTDVTGRQEKYAYDSCGRLAKTTYSDGTTEEYTYDTMGRTVSVLSSSGAKTRYTYDALGRVTKAESVGKKVDMATDGPKSKIWTYAYDNMDRVTEVTDPEDYKTSQTYDAFGNTTSQTDAKGGTTTYTYDDHSNLISTTNAIGVTKTYEYDEKDRLVKSVNGRGQETTYTYDTYDRLISTKDALGTTEYTYSQYGELLTVKDSTGSIIRTYDTLGRVTSVTDCNGKTVKYGYDELGNRISLTYAGGEIVRYAYRADGLLESVADGDGRVTGYTYDDSGRLLTAVRPDGTTETCSYDGNGSLIKLETKQKDGTVLQSYSYTYDGFGNIVKTEETSAYKMPVADYSKESDGYQASVTRGRESDTEEDKETESASENHEEVSEVITTSTMEYNEANELIRFNGEEVTYDADGNMLHGPLNGEMADFTYDCRNRLISAGDTKYFYDAEDVRIRVENPEYTEVYITDRESELSQTLEIERTDKAGEKEFSRCYYGMGLLYEIVSAEESGSDKGNGNKKNTTANKGNSELRFYHFDYLGSTRWITDVTGKPQYGFRYGTYGEFLSVWRATEKTPEELNLTDLTTPVRFLYNGELGVATDDNTLLYMRQRYYDTEIKRFINQDILTGSIGDSQSLNRYAYVQGNPVSFSDPFGLSPFDRLEKAFQPVHAVLNIMSIIPGPIGGFADLAQAGLYLLEGNTGLAGQFLSQSLMTFLAGPAGQYIAGKLSKLPAAARIMIGVAFGSYATYKGIQAGEQLYLGVSEVAEGLINGDMSWDTAFYKLTGCTVSAAGLAFSFKGALLGFETTIGGLDEMAATYAAKQAAWYKEHAGYTTNNLDNIQESGASVLPHSISEKQSGCSTIKNSSKIDNSSYYEYKALRQQGYTASEAYDLMKEFRKGNNPNNDYVFHFTTYKGGKGIIDIGGVKGSKSGIAGKGVYAGTTPTPSWALKHIPYCGWGLGKTPVRIPIKITSDMRVDKPLIPIKTKVIRGDFLKFEMIGD